MPYAATLNEYSVPLVRPETVADAVDEAAASSYTSVAGFSWYTRYPETGAAVVELTAVQVKETSLVPAVAAKFVGAAGRVTAVKSVVAVAVATAFTETTLKVYSVPAVSPVKVYVVSLASRVATNVLPR